MRGGPGVYLPLKRRRPPRGEGSEVPVLEGACLGSSPEARVLSSLDVQSARAADPGSGVAASPGGGPDALAMSLQWSGVDARAGRAIRISAHRRVGLTFKRRFNEWVVSSTLNSGTTYFLRNKGESGPI